MQRASLLAAVSLCACASGAGGSQVGPDGGAAAACETSAACDDGDRCTAEACDLATGTCVVSAIDWCAGSTPVAEEDFESRPERPVSHDNFFSAGEGEQGWQADPTGACPVDVAAVVDDDFEDYGKPAAFVHGAGGWLFTTPAGASVSLVTSPDGGYAMNVVGSTASGSYGQAAHPLTPQPSGWVELRVRAPGNFKPKMVQLAENGDTRFSLIFDADGQIKYSSGGSPVALRGYVADTWYPIRLDWDAGRDRASLELAGADHPDLPLHAPITHYIDAVRIKTATATGLSVMVDEVRASGGEGVHDGEGSLRVGAPLASCEATSNASLAFAPARSGVLDLDLMAEGDGGPYEIRLVEGGDGAGERMALSLEAGEFYWSQGAVRTALPVASRWSAGDWIHVTIRWHADLDAVDVAIGDDPPAVRLRPSAAITSGVDRLRVIAPPGGALWVDDLHIAAATGDP